MTRFDNHLTVSWSALSMLASNGLVICRLLCLYVSAKSSFAFPNKPLTAICCNSSGKYSAIAIEGAGNWNMLWKIAISHKSKIEDTLVGVKDRKFSKYNSRLWKKGNFRIESKNIRDTIRVYSNKFCYANFTVKPTPDLPKLHNHHYN